MYARLVEMFVHLFYCSLFTLLPIHVSFDGKVMSYTSCNSVHLVCTLLSCMEPIAEGAISIEFALGGCQGTQLNLSNYCYCTFVHIFSFLEASLTFDIYFKWLRPSPFN